MAAAALPIRIAAQRVAVLGLGRSGWAAAEWVRGEGGRVRGFEEAPAEDLAARWRTLGEPRDELRDGRIADAAAALSGCALLVRSPGAPADHRLLAAARAQGVPIVSEIELAAAAAETPVLAITGTNGKSTTTAWTAHLLERAGIAAVACGNIGHPFSQAVREAPAAIFVVEVSSFQLEDCPTFHPRGAAILNVSPDHLDRHGTFAAYADAKWALTRNQGAADLLALGPGLLKEAGRRGARARRLLCDPEDRAAAAAIFLRADRLSWRQDGGERPLLAASELALPGPHNLLNAMVAFALAAEVAPDPQRLIPGLRDFAGLPHRLETAGTAGGVTFVNDSKATNVDSLRVALQSFTQPVVLIAGGRDKEGPFETIAALVRERVRHLVLIGEAASRIRRAFPDVSAETAADLEAAVHRAHAAAGAGGLVLLSPGCASFDMFRDYRERGERFKALVARLPGASIPAAAGRPAQRR